MSDIYTLWYVFDPRTTIMHSDRGFSVNPEIGFNTFVDINGNKAKDMACPAHPTWRKYLADRYAQYASIHPRRLWREDDFSKTPEEFLPHEKNWASLLSSFGFVTTIIPVQADLTIENQIIAIASQLL